MDRPKSPAEQYAAIKSAYSTASRSITTKSTSRAATPIKSGIRDGGSDNNVGYPALAKYENGKLKKLTITSTLIKTLFHQLNDRGACPQKIYQTYLTANKSNSPTEAMQKGLYFESLCLGKGRTGQSFDLPRLKSGAKSIDQIRIDEQAEMFEMVANSYNLMVIKEGDLCNVQIPWKKKLESGIYPDIEFELSCGIDLLSPINIINSEINYEMAVIDLKLTKDRDLRFGEFSWGDPDSLDPIQGVLYSYITGLPFLYLVFDYRPEGRGHKLLPLITTALFKNRSIPQWGEPEWENWNLANQRFRDLKQSIKMTGETIVKWDTAGYPETPSYEQCERCPLNPMYPGGICKSVNHIKRM